MGVSGNTGVFISGKLNDGVEVKTSTTSSDENESGSGSSNVQAQVSNIGSNTTISSEAASGKQYT